MENGWTGNGRGRLVTLLEMQRFYADYFVGLTRAIFDLQVVAKIQEESVVSDDDRKELERRLDIALKCCRPISLRVSVAQIERAL